MVSSRCCIASTSATASSRPATITVLVRSTTVRAKSSASAVPTSPWGAPVSVVPGIFPSALPCVKSSRTTVANSCASMFRIGRMRMVTEPVIGTSSSMAISSRAASTFSLAPVTMIELVFSSATSLSGLVRSNIKSAVSMPLRRIRKRRTCSCNALARLLAPGVAAASIIFCSEAATAGAAALLRRTNSPSLCAQVGSVSIPATRSAISARSSGSAAIANELRPGTGKTFTGPRTTRPFGSVAPADVRPKPLTVCAAASAERCFNSTIKSEPLASGRMPCSVAASAAMSS